MKSVLRYTLILLLTYFVAWTTAYLLTMYNAVHRLDFSEYFHWLVLAWTFEGLEMVAITWLLSMAIFVPLAIVVMVVLIKRGRRNAPAA